MTETAISFIFQHFDTVQRLFRAHNVDFMFHRNHAGLERHEGDSIIGYVFLVTYSTVTFETLTK